MRNMGILVNVTLCGTMVVCIHKVLAYMVECIVEERHPLTSHTENSPTSIGVG